MHRVRFPGPCVAPPDLGWLYVRSFPEAFDEQVRDPTLVALQRQLQHTRREGPGPAGPDPIATADMRDEVMQQLYGVGLAMQITRRRSDSPPVATRITDHLDQLQ